MALIKSKSLRMEIMHSLTQAIVSTQTASTDASKAGSSLAGELQLITATLRSIQLRFIGQEYAQ